MALHGAAESQPAQRDRRQKTLRRESQDLARGIEQCEIAGQLRTLTVGRRSAALEKVVQESGAHGAEQNQRRQVHQKWRLLECGARGIPGVARIGLLVVRAGRSLETAQHRPRREMQNRQKQQQGLHIEPGCAAFRQQSAEDAAEGSGAGDSAELMFGGAGIQNLARHAPETA